ncbi:MAG: cobalamin-dependent protein [Elusimicrobia bacterium]|nr:cobalamin-dependent protein [Elusimicrobiota bacterium]
MGEIEILLVQPPHRQDPGVPYLGREAPLGIAYLAAYLEKQKISAEIMDLSVSDDCFVSLADAIKRYKPKFVGVSAFTVDIVMADRIAENSKKIDPGIITVVGGIHATVLPGKTLREFSHFDFLVHGQGERPLSELIGRLKQGKDYADIRGLAYRKDGTVRVNPAAKENIPLDELPLPAREKLDFSLYAPHPQKYMTLPSTPILASIGCPYSCSYCSIHAVHPGYNVRKPEKVVGEIEECVARYGIRDFRFMDDCFGYDRESAVELCRLILDRKLKIHWVCLCRVDTVDLEILKLMKRAGCHQVSYGIEAGTEKAQHIINKHITIEQARKAVGLTKKAGLDSSASFIIGIPGETIEDMERTIEFAKEISPDIALFYICKAYPGTPLFSKFVKTEEDLNINWEDYLIQGPPVFDIGIPPDKIVSLLKKAYRCFYFRPGYMLQRIRKIFRSPARELSISLKGAGMVFSYFRK